MANYSRIIKAAFWSDEKVGALSIPARLLYIGLWSFSNKLGVVYGDVSWLTSHIYASDRSVGALEVSSWLKELESAQRIFRFKKHDKEWFFIPRFRKYQKGSYPSTELNPDPPDEIIDEVRKIFSDFENVECCAAAETQSIVLSFDCVNGKFWGLSQEKIEQYQKSYPAVDVPFECRKAWQWLIDNPARRKTYSGMSSFLNRWLAKCQNSGKVSSSSPQFRVSGRYNFTTKHEKSS